MKTAEQWQSSGWNSPAREGELIEAFLHAPGSRGGSLASLNESGEHEVGNPFVGPRLSAASDRTLVQTRFLPVERVHGKLRRCQCSCNPRKEPTCTLFPLHNPFFCDSQDTSLGRLGYEYYTVSTTYSSFPMTNLLPLLVIKGFGWRKNIV